MKSVKEAKYLLNPKTCKLHIRGYCHLTKNPDPNWLGFDTEDEALAHDGRAVGMCKTCSKRKDGK